MSGRSRRVVSSMRMEQSA